MKASEIIGSVRFDINDQAQTTYSSYQLVDKFNTALRLINSQLVNMSSSLVQNTVPLTIVSGVATIPIDFQEPLRVQGASYELFSSDNPIDQLDSKSFRIIGSSIYFNVNATTATLEYKQSFPAVTLDDNLIIIPDIVPLPDSFFDLFKQVIKDLLAGTMQNDVTAYIQSQVTLLVSRRERTKLVRKKLFRL